MTAGTRCTADQEAQWLLYRLAPWASAYHILLPVRIRTALDVTLLARAVELLGGRHDALRATFHERDGHPVRAVVPQPPRLEVRDAPDPTPHRLRELIREIYAEPFQLSVEGPARLVLLRHGTEDATLVVVTHHITADANSQFILLRDLVRAYRGLVDGAGPGWAPLPATLAEHADAERRLLASPRGQRLRAYWRDRAAGSVPARVPADRAAPPVPTFRGATHDLWLTGDTGTRIAAAARELGVTPFAVLAGAFQALLYRYCGLADFLIGCPTTARLAAGTRDLVGNLVNTLLLRAEFGRGTTLRQAMVEAQRQVREGIAHAAVPVVLGAADSGLAQPFRIVFTLVAMDRLEPPLGMPGEGEPEGPVVPYGGLRLSLVDVPQQEGQFELSVKVLQCGDAYRFVLTYNTDLYERSTVERLAAHYRILLRAALDAPDNRIAAVSLVDRAELDRMLAGAGLAG